LHLHTCVYIFCTIFTLLPSSSPLPWARTCSALLFLNSSEGADLPSGST
jgi:hypothetical protein